MGQPVKYLTSDRRESAHEDSDGAADEAQHNRLDEKLPEDMIASGADGHAKPDFAGPLGHRDQHDVHDAHAADDQRDRATANSRSLIDFVVDDIMSVISAMLRMSKSSSWPSRKWWRSRNRAVIWSMASSIRSEERALA